MISSHAVAAASLKYRVSNVVTMLSHARLNADTGQIKEAGIGGALDSMFIGWYQEYSTQRSDPLGMCLLPTQAGASAQSFCAVG